MQPGCDGFDEAEICRAAAVNIPVRLCRCMRCRQMCSIEDAKADFESVMKLKPNHTSAVRELASLSDLQAAFQQLQQLQQLQKDAASSESQQLDLGSARQVLDKVFELAPDCIPAQLLDAQLEMLQGNYEQVRA